LPLQSPKFHRNRSYSYKQTYEKLEDHSKQLESIDNALKHFALSVNDQDKRLRVVEGSKKKAK